MRFALATSLAFALSAFATTEAPGDTDYSRCLCPLDNHLDNGVHINTGVVWWQCAYPNGACMWDTNGNLMNTAQSNCAATQNTCVNENCTCGHDLYGDTGTYINHGTVWWQCAYPNGACMWDQYGSLMNTAQTNCPKSTVCLTK